MASFEEMLKASLAGVNAQVDAADTDLHQEVASAAEGVERITGGKVSLFLRRARDAASEVIYGLVLGKTRSDREIMGFRLGPTGYPITAAPNSSYFKEETASHLQRVLGNRDELRKVFSELASDPGSPLVIALAFFLRRNRSEKVPDQE